MQILKISSDWPWTDAFLLAYRPSAGIGNSRTRNEQAN